MTRHESISKLRDGFLFTWKRYLNLSPLIYIFFNKAKKSSSTVLFLCCFRYKN